jgi:peptidoglycan hydrolase CwlO-like protein
MEAQTGALVLTVLALLISMGNLIIAALNARVKRAEVDTKTQALVVDLAAEVPSLRSQLNLELARHDQYQVEAERARIQVAQLKAYIASLQTQVRRLTQKVADFHARNEKLEARNTELKKDMDTLKRAMEGLRR